MAQTTISDFVIWAKQIHGDPMVAERILTLRAGETINLKVDGVPGVWRKMDDGRDGRPTRGVRPIGRTQKFWRELYAERRGEVVEIDVTPADCSREASPAALTISPPFAASAAERQAAAEAVRALAGQGWRSTEPYGPRDELYER